MSNTQLSSIDKLTSHKKNNKKHPISGVDDLLTDCIERVTELVEDDDIEDILREKLYMDHCVDILINTLNFTSSIESQLVSGNPLRNTQKLAIIGFLNWILEKIESPKIGHIVMPMGQGKTNTAIMLSTLCPKKVIYLSTDNSGIDQTVDSFNHHYTSSNFVESSQKIDSKVSENNTGKVLVGMYQEFMKALESGALNTDDIDMIFVDEADINGLSKERRTYFDNLSQNTGIIIIGMSATEVQGSGLTLQSVFTDEILHIPIPESLPELYDMGLTPDIDFRDVIIDQSFTTTSQSIDVGVGDTEINKLVGSDTWIHNIFKYHDTHNTGKTFILGYRNNAFNKRNIEIAAQYGIRIAQFTGEESLTERSQILEKLKRKEIDGIVGSALVGRGLDIPNCEVVYNSTVTYSPQIFWQLGGRGFRIDPENEDKHTDFVTFLPKDIFVDDGKSLDFSSFPLSSSSFFNKEYFEGKTIGTDSYYRLRDLSKEEILSVSDFVRKSKEARTMDAYGDNIELLAQVLLDFPHLSRRIIKTLGMKSLRALYRINKKGSSSKKSSRKKYIRRRKLEGLDMDFTNTKVGKMSFQRERELLDDVNNTDSQKSLGVLIDYHMPLFKALAKACYIENSYISEEDLVQAGIETFISKIREKNSIGKEGRIVSYVLDPIYTEIEKVATVSQGEFYYGPEDSENDDRDITIKRDILLLQDYVGENDLNIETLDIQVVSDDLGINTKRVLFALEILKLKMYPNMKGLEDIGGGIDPEELFFQGELGDQLNATLLRMQARTERVLRLRFGLGGYQEDNTLDETAEQIGVTKERIRQMEMKAIRLLKHPSRSHRMRPYLEDLDK